MPSHNQQMAGVPDRLQEFVNAALQQGIALFNPHPTDRLTEEQQDTRQQLGDVMLAQCDRLDKKNASEIQTITDNCHTKLSCSIEKNNEMYNEHSNIEAKEELDLMSQSLLNILEFLPETVALLFELAAVRAYFKHTMMEDLFNQAENFSTCWRQNFGFIERIDLSTLAVLCLVASYISYMREPSVDEATRSIKDAANRAVDASPIAGMAILRIATCCSDFLAQSWFDHAADSVLWTHSTLVPGVKREFDLDDQNANIAKNVAAVAARTAAAVMSLRIAMKAVQKLAAEALAEPEGAGAWYMTAMLPALVENIDQRAARVALIGCGNPLVAGPAVKTPGVGDEHYQKMFSLGHVNANASAQMVSVELFLHAIGVPIEQLAAAETCENKHFSSTVAKWHAANTKQKVLLDVQPAFIQNIVDSFVAYFADAPPPSELECDQLRAMIQNLEVFHAMIRGYVGPVKSDNGSTLTQLGFVYEEYCRAFATPNLSTWIVSCVRKLLQTHVNHRSPPSDTQTYSSLCPSTDAIARLCAAHVIGTSGALVDMGIKSFAFNTAPYKADMDKTICRQSDYSSKAKPAQCIPVTVDDYHLPPVEETGKLHPAAFVVTTLGEGPFIFGAPNQQAPGPKYKNWFATRRLFHGLVLKLATKDLISNTGGGTVPHTDGERERMKSCATIDFIRAFSPSTAVFSFMAINKYIQTEGEQMSYVQFSRYWRQIIAHVLEVTSRALREVAAIAPYADLTASVVNALAKIDIEDYDFIVKTFFNDSQNGRKKAGGTTRKRKGDASISHESGQEQLPLPTLPHAELEAFVDYDPNEPTNDSGLVSFEFFLGGPVDPNIPNVIAVPEPQSPQQSPHQSPHQSPQKGPSPKRARNQRQRYYGLVLKDEQSMPAQSTPAQ